MAIKSTSEHPYGMPPFILNKRPVMVMVGREKRQLYMHPKPMVNLIFADIFCREKI
jgi:hypothetical protein